MSSASAPKAASHNRDNFSAAVARTLAERAGFRCSNPGCRRPTIGPSPANSARSIYSGEAAHINAAASGGPRPDDTLTPEQRSSIENGIHLCASCADIIDKNNGEGFSTILLQAWKLEREAEVSAAHGTGNLALPSPDSIDFSYQPDFRILRDQTRRSLDTLMDFAQIVIPGGIVKINRAIDNVLIQSAIDGSVLVVGDPGAGKSGCSFQAIVELLDKGNDVVALPVEEFAALSRGQLRDELGLAHDFLDVLCQWPGDKPAYLFIDALDAARDGDAARAFRQMIAAIHKHALRWHIIASIRKYDLRHSDELRRNFMGQPIQPFVDAEFSTVRHLNVPVLTDAELSDVASQSEELGQLLIQGGNTTKALLRNAFNLRLAADLLLDEATITELTPIHTQSELLERYWDRRVARPDSEQDARQLVLSRAVEAMIESRSLQVERTRVIADDVRSSAPLHDLLHDNVLVEWQSSPSARVQKELLAFPHHIPFDYAVSRILRGHPATLIKRLTKNPKFVLSLRASVVLYYHYLWNLDTENRGIFWETINAISGAVDVSMLGKLIGPSVAADLIKVPQDYAVLLETLTAARTPEERSAPETAILQLRGAAIARNDWNSSTDKTIWCKFVQDAASKAESVSEITLRALAELISTLGRIFNSIVFDGQQALGEAARILLRFAWARKPSDEWLILQGIDAVCRTCSTDPLQSIALLHPVIDPVRISEFGYTELPRLTDYVGQIAVIAPDFASKIYSAAYNFKEESREQTIALDSLIMPISSNRRQDYGMAFYNLQQGYKKFLKAAPMQATLALIRVLTAFVDSQSAEVGDTTVQPAESFDWDGAQAFVRADASYIWAEGWAASQHEPVQMLNEWASQLEMEWIAPANTEVLKAVFDLLIAENRIAIFWARVLKSATVCPDRLYRQVLPLLSAPPILLCADTRYEAGEALRVLLLLLHRHRTKEHRRGYSVYT